MSEEQIRGSANSDVPARLGAPPPRVTVTADQVGRLVADQFPQWAGLPIGAVTGGWDNWTFRLGPGMSVRLPSAAEYALAVEKEHRWLPVLATQLPLPISTPLGRGEPGAGYPFAWSVYHWLTGSPAGKDRVRDPIRFASDLAEFLVELQHIDPAGGPPPGKHNWFRGGTLRTFDGTVRDALGALGSSVEASLVREIWAVALDAHWDGTCRWFHGDVAAGNLLVRNGELAAVIDFGTCGVGDPSCDLAAAWTLLNAEGRQVFRDRLQVAEDAWARGRGWALWKTLATCASSADQPLSEDNGGARGVLDEILAEYEHQRPPNRASHRSLSHVR